jgi:hypothetical protein
METVLAAIVTGAITLIGVIIANGKTTAVMEVKIEELTREVREHNNFARRMPLVEQEVKHLWDEFNQLKESLKNNT